MIKKLNLVPVDSPCRLCDRRRLACHSQCQEFSTYREQIDSFQSYQKISKIKLTRKSLQMFRN